MKPNKRPTKLNILGHEIAVKWGRANLPEASTIDFGQSHADERWLAVAPERCQDEAIVEATLLHEICHTIFGLTGSSALLGDEKEEAVVTALENGLYPVIIHLVELGFFRHKTLQPKVRK